MQPVYFRPLLPLDKPDAPWQDAAVNAIITVQNVFKHFGSRRVLDGVSFAVGERDRIGLVGLNGAGKSTLLRLIVGDDQPDSGLITRQRGMRLAYVPQEPLLSAEDTVENVLARGLAAHRELLDQLAALEAGLAQLTGGALERALEEQAHFHHLLGQAGWDRDHEMAEIATRLELPKASALIGTLSGGEKRRVALAQALLSRPDLLALDEPTNHLDAFTVEWLEQRLRDENGALLLVTHDRYFLDRVASRIVEIDRGALHSYEGGYARFLEAQAERLHNENERERARQAFVRRELDWIRRGPQARGTKQQARIDRFDAQVAAKPSTADKRSEPLSLKLPTGGRLGKTILEIHHLSKSIAGKTLFSDLNLILKPGDRIGIVGPNGAGKTTLIRTLLGMQSADAGEVVLGQNTRISYLDQGRVELDDQRSVLQEVAGDSEHVHLEDGPVHVRTFLRMMLFDDGFADTKVGSLSGGERNRVQLAKLLRKGGNLLVLDEPTNDLDLMTLGVLEAALRDFPGCALVVSHDRWFLDQVATGILAFSDGGETGRVTFYEGDYSSYLARRQAKLTVAAPAKSPTKPVVAAAPAKPAPKLSYKEKQELAGIEAAILAAEAEVSAKEAVVGDPALYRERATEVPAAVAALDAAKEKVAALYARWEVLEAKK